MPSDVSHRPSASDFAQVSPCTWLRLRKLSRQLTQLYDKQLASYGLTVTQFSLLAHLRGLDGIGIGALAEVMVMDPTALTRALKPLERQGLVALTCDEKDKRARRVRITAEGRDSYEAARTGWRTAQRHVDTVLQAGDARGLNALLETLIDHMKIAPVPQQADGAVTHTASSKEPS